MFNLCKLVSYKRHCFVVYTVGIEFLVLKEYTCFIPILNSFMHSLFARVVLLTIPGSFLLGTLASLAGLCIFAHFANLGCDPLVDGKINNPNQVKQRQKEELGQS